MLVLYSFGVCSETTEIPLAHNQAYLLTGVVSSPPENYLENLQTKQIGAHNPHDLQTLHLLEERFAEGVPLRSRQAAVRTAYFSGAQGVQNCLFSPVIAMSF